MHTAAFLDYLEREKQHILDHCTRCGKCVQVCPMPQHDAGLQQADPVQVVTGVIELLRTGAVSLAARAWAMSCSMVDRPSPRT